MKHIFKKGEQGKPIFLLLHGTGGNEKDLLPLAEMLDASYSVLSIKGEVNENGMARYFKRLAEGKYDVEDLEYRSKELYNFIKQVAKEQAFNLEDIIPVGFSNGANMAINLILKDETPFKKALLFAPLYPLDLQNNKKDLSQFEAYLSMGEYDPIVTRQQSEDVIKIFKDRGAKVTEHWVGSHEITQESVVAARDIL